MVSAPRRRSPAKAPARSKSLPGTGRWSPPGWQPNQPPGRKTFAVGEVLVSPDGHRVERILVRRRVDGPAREMLRKHGTYFVVDCATVPEVAQLVDLATLVPEQRTRE
jgi:hypothetical protein